jgi:riboflavin transporter FmnP
MHLGLFALLGYVLLVFTFAFALWKGGVAERIGGSMNLAAGILVLSLHWLIGADAQPIAELVVDAALAAGFLFLAIRFASLWLGVAMLLQAVQFSLHAYYMVTEIPHDWNYARINNVDTTGINLMIIAGTVIALRKRARDQREADRKAAEAAARTASPGPA